MLTSQQADNGCRYQCTQNTKNGKYQGKPPAKIENHHRQQCRFYGTVRKKVRQVKVRGAFFAEGFQKGIPGKNRPHRYNAGSCRKENTPDPGPVTQKI